MRGCRHVRGIRMEHPQPEPLRLRHAREHHARRGRGTERRVARWHRNPPSPRSQEVAGLDRRPQSAIAEAEPAKLPRSDDPATLHHRIRHCHPHSLVIATVTRHTTPHAVHGNTAREPGEELRGLIART
ncbi:hypothetical protein GCM10027071_00730 [Microbacterium marinum]